MERSDTTNYVVRIFNVAQDDFSEELELDVKVSGWDGE